jgi:hypothetical protein
MKLLYEENITVHNVKDISMILLICHRPYLPYMSSTSPQLLRHLGSTTRFAKSFKYL